VPKVDKNIAQVGDATLEGGPISFPQDYAKWKKTCSSLKGGAIGVLKGDLLDALKNHVKPFPIARPASDNEGDTGSYIELDKLDKIMMSRKNGIFFEQDYEDFEAIEADIDDLLIHPSLNPQNIMFSIPSKYNKKDGSYPEGIAMEPIYGHYLDEYFKTKHKDNLQGRTYNSTWSNKEQNTATPPIYQALVGGELVPMGLLEIIQKAQEELENREFKLTIDTAKPAKYLMAIPDFKRAVGKAISSSRVGDEVSVSKVMSKLINRDFKSNTDAKTKKLLARYAGIKNIAGDFVSFRIALTPAKTRKIIKDYYDSTGTGTKRRTLTKSWRDMLVI